MIKTIGLCVGVMLLTQSGVQALGLKLSNAKTDANADSTQSSGPGGQVKSTLDRLDQLESNVKGSNELLDNCSSSLKKIARNSAAEKELKQQIASLEADAKKEKKDKKETTAAKKELEENFWSDPKNLTEAKKKGLSAKQREELLNFGVQLGVAAGGMAGEIDGAQKLVTDVGSITPAQAKEETKGNPLQAAKTLSRVKDAPGTISSIQKELPIQARRIAVLSKAVKFLTAE